MVCGCCWHQRWGCLFSVRAYAKQGVLCCRFHIRMKELEDLLIEKISTSSDDILSDQTLIESLEDVKATSIELQAKVEQSKITEEATNQAREVCSPRVSMCT